MSIDLRKLAEPFPSEDVEWRIQESGKKQDGAVWAKVIPYITSRAVQQRLDEVCGPENWRNEFRDCCIGDKHGALCGISIRINDEWVTKWDGSDATGIEAFKGGLSGAMKRAACHWQIGRYLYHLDAYFATIVPKGTDKAYFAGKNDKKGTPAFFWLPPLLPLDALPDDERRKHLREPERTEPPAAKSNGRTPRNDHGGLEPSTDGRNTLAALAQLKKPTANDRRKFAKWETEIRDRIKAGHPYTADDVKLLEKALSDAEKRLSLTAGVPHTDEPAGELFAKHENTGA